MNRRRTGQIAAGLGALVCFGFAGWAAHTSAMPEFRIYDGYLMMMGAAIAILITAPLVWHWPRERSVVAITAAATIGCFLPLVISALRHGMPVMVRLRGSWILGGADMVGPALIVGSICLWYALREHGTEKSRLKRS
ncbi:MAG TPA: hypothetical protein VIM84_03445 [Gemmatimonadales bacterium]